MLALLAVNWEPELRGYVIVAISVAVLIGGTYLVVATNLGARLGFLVVLAGLFGWMAAMGAIWWTYGIGLKGAEPTWEPYQPTSIVQDASLLDDAEVIDFRIELSNNATQDAKSVVTALQDQEWLLLEESDPQRGQAVAAADEIIQVEQEVFAAGEYLPINVFDKGGKRWPKINESLDFVAFFHTPHFALVEIAPTVEQHAEPGQAPVVPKVDETKQHQYVYMYRDLGSRRVPAIFITIGSTLIFLLLCLLLHRRDLLLRNNVGDDSSERRGATS